MEDGDDVASAPTLGPAAEVGSAATIDSGSPAARSATPRPAATPGGDYADLTTIEPKHYAIGAVLGRGGMGRITVARDRRLGRDVAIKELIAPSDSLRRRFEREARITARLQHPSIVSVHEAGVWPDGEPFIAMKLVVGKSLDLVIAEKTTLAERLSLLPAVIAAVEALAYAHSRRVIHRDLKPHNILVGEFGETVVIDWGLAKELDHDGDDDPMPAARAPDGDVKTMHGSVLGTPAFMPPEQAAGEPVDERADVYALGAILYTALAGEPPYTGKSADDVLARVLVAPPVPIERKQPRLPADLVTIVGKALAREPADRYPSARELAEDLRRFQTGQLVAAHRYSRAARFVRWVRRHRAAVAVGAALLAVLAVVSVISVRRIVRERDGAEAARARAELQESVSETRRAAAETLIDFMIQELRSKLEQVGRLDVLEGLGDQILAYYQTLEAAGPAKDEAGLDRRAEAWCLLSDILRKRGENARAIELAQRCLDLRAQVTAAAPDDLLARRRWVSAHAVLGDAHLRGLAPEPALEVYRRGLAEAQTLVAQPGATANDHRELAIMHESIAKCLADMGDVDAAAAGYREGVAIYTRLRAADDDNAQLAMELSTTLSLLGQVEWVRGDLGAARDWLVEAVARAEDAARLSPGDVLAVEAVASTRGSLGDIDLERGDLDAAERAYRASLAAYERVLAADPSHREVLRELANAQNLLGVVLEERGAYAEARKLHTEALATGRTLVRDRPDNAMFRRDLAVNLDRLGKFEQRRGRHAEAEAVLRESIAIIDALAEADPDNAELQRDRGVGRETLGDLELHRDRTPEAFALYREALQIAEALAARDPSNADWARDRVAVLTKIGDARLAAGDAAVAVTEFRAALVLADELVARDRSNVTWLRDAADLEVRIGDAELEREARVEALVAYRAGLARRDAALALEPDSAELQLDVALVLARVAYLLDKGDDERRRLLDRATQMLDALRAADALGPLGEALVVEVRKLRR
jgi:tetratricopeptide (TPR) repeat protein